MDTDGNDGGLLQGIILASRWRNSVRRINLLGNLNLNVFG
jgi:hypothetical protein